MSEKISNLPLYTGGDNPDGDIPISVLGTTYRIKPSKLGKNLQNVTDLGATTTNDIQLINDANAIFGTGGGIILDNGSKLKEGTIDATHGGSKGIAQICAVGYELKWEAGRQYVMNDGGTTIREASFNFNNIPSIYDDINKGFIVGSRWILDNGNLYICTDNTIDTAVWELQMIGTQDLQSVTDNGNQTRNSIVVNNATNSTEINRNSVITSNDTTTSYAYIENTGTIGVNSGAFEGTIKSTDLTTNNVDLEFPNKATGSYTIATTVDIPTVDLIPTNGSSNAVSSDGVFDALADKVDKVTGKGLSTNDYTTLEQTKLAGIAAGAEVNVNADWNATSGDAQILNKPSIPSISGLATTSYVDTQDALKVDKVAGSRLITSAESTVLGNTSGTNTGDNAVNSLYSGLSTSKQDTLTLTTTGTSGAATLVGATLNIPQYASSGGDMLKSTYDTDNTGVVDNAECISIIGRNATGATLRKGTIVYISGSTGNRPNFVKAKADAEATSAGTFGVIQNDIANNADGYCTTLGYLDNLDTRSTATYPFTSDTLADGDTIYLSPTTAGYITNTKPSAPNHLVYLGKVTRTSPTNGTIVYRIQNGYELEELHNVAISSIANNDLLIYESSTTLWKNKTITAAMLPTGIDASKIDGGNVSNTEFSYLDGVTSAIQTQIDGKIGVTQVTPVTLTTGGWTLVSGLYQYTYSNGSITSASIVDVIPSSASITVVKAADIMPATLSATGTVTIYATNLPTASIVVTFNIFK